MRAKSLVLAALAAWILPMAAPHDARADLPIKPLDPKDHFSIGTDPWVPDDRHPGRIVVSPQQTVIDTSRDAARNERAIRVYLFWERFLRVLRIGGIVR